MYGMYNIMHASIITTLFAMSQLYASHRLHAILISAAAPLELSNVL
jgi:hypothetical protein